MLLKSNFFMKSKNSSIKNILILICIIAGVFFIHSELNSQTITWQRSYIINPFGDFRIEGIAQKDDGGYIAAGYLSTASKFGMFAMGLSPYGDSLWYHVYNTAYPAFAIIKLNDGNFIIISWRSELVKINFLGDTIWTSPRNGFNLGCTDIKYVNNEFFICGENRSSENPFLLKIDSSGKEIFYREYSNFHYSTFRDVIVYKNEIFINGEEIVPSHTFLIRTDSIGNIKNIRNYEWWFLARSMIKNPFEESILLAGHDHINGRLSAAMVKLNFSGDIIWKKHYDPGGETSGLINIILNDINGGVISFGKFFTNETYNYSRLMKFDYEGNEIWRRQYGYENDHLLSKCIIQTSDSGYIFGADRTQFMYKFDVIKTDKLGNVTVSIKNNNITLPSDFELYQNYPNPFNPSTTISFSLKKSSFVKLKVFDITGKEIKVLINERKQAGSYEMTFDATNLPSGVYFYQIEVDDFNEVKKMVLLK